MPVPAKPRRSGRLVTWDSPVSHAVCVWKAGCGEGARESTWQVRPSWTGLTAAFFPAACRRRLGVENRFVRSTAINNPLTEPTPSRLILNVLKASDFLERRGEAQRRSLHVETLASPGRGQGTQEPDTVLPSACQPEPAKWRGDSSWHSAPGTAVAWLVGQ